MINSKVSSLLVEQINKEFFSSYLYLDISNYYEKQGLRGFANWFKIQAQEELDHGMLIYQYLHDNAQDIVLGAISAPNTNFTSLKDGLKLSLSHEQTVTASINNIYSVAVAEKEYRTMQFLDWFIKEQGEEEKNTAELVARMELFGEDSKALYMLDNELSSRTYTAPSLTL